MAGTLGPEWWEGYPTDYWRPMLSGEPVNYIFH
jgi:hypothetical protein